MKSLFPAALFACLVLTSLSARSAEAVRVVATDLISNARQPQAFVGEDGTIYVVFGSEHSIHCSRSADRGKTFAAPVRVGELTSLALGKRRGPRIAATAESVVITAAAHGREGGVVAWRSTDQGRTWHGPVTVNDTGSNTAAEGLHAMAVSPDGAFYCVWLDLRDGNGNNLYGARSDDGGRTWSTNRRVYDSPSQGICPCCHPAVTYDSAGNLHVMWRNELGGDRDMYHAVSRDGGETFSDAGKLGTGSWTIDFCPMDGGCIAATGPDEITTAWRRDKQIFRTTPEETREQLLGHGEQPWAAGTRDGAYIVWISKRGGDLWLLHPGEARPRKLAPNAVDPVIATPASGTGPVVVVWQTGGESPTAMATVLPD
jgi:hypothetical protein